MAKERGLKGYSRLRKAELINVLRVILDDDIPAIGVRVLQPVAAPRPNRIIAAINTYVKPTLVEIKKAFDWGKKSTLDVGSFITKNLNDLIYFTPVLFHNLSGYDIHLFIKNLGVTEGNINCIPNNEEKYISFTKDIVVGEYTNKNGKVVDVKQQLRFIDSLKFMASSLDNYWWKTWIRFAV